MKPVSAAPFTFEVVLVEKFLATRAFAKDTLRSLQDQTPNGTDTVRIDFTGVIAMTISFADEFLGEYYAALASRDTQPAVVTLTGLNEDLRETISICLQRRDLLALEDHDGDPGLLAASDVLKETFELARRLETFTALKVADELGISAPNANNRLKRLVAGRALLRQQRVAERGGKEFTYSMPGL